MVKLSSFTKSGNSIRNRIDIYLTLSSRPVIGLTCTPGLPFVYFHCSPKGGLLYSWTEIIGSKQRAKHGMLPYVRAISSWCLKQTKDIHPMSELSANPHSCRIIRPRPLSLAGATNERATLHEGTARVNDLTTRRYFSAKVGCLC